MSSISFIQKLASSRNQNILLLSGIDDTGYPCYFFVFVKEKSLPILINLKEGEKVNLLEHGRILESGYGEPNNELLRRMRDDYGFEA